MRLASIKPARAGVDLHTFECAACNHVLKKLAANEDPMKSKGLWTLASRRFAPTEVRRAGVSRGERAGSPRPPAEFFSTLNLPSIGSDSTMCWGIAMLSAEPVRVFKGGSSW